MFNKLANQVKQPWFENKYFKLYLCKHGRMELAHSLHVSTLKLVCIWKIDTEQTHCAISVSDSTNLRNNSTYSAVFDITRFIDCILKSDGKNKQSY